MSSIIGLVSAVVLVWSIGYFAGWILYEQYAMIKDRNRRRKVREELDRIFRDR
jgi:hypothetical protein